MSSLTIDPDLRGALEDLIKEDGRGKLFRGLGVGEIAGAFALPDQTASFAQTGLTSVERHILAVHRDELAFVLNSAFITNHHATPESGGKRFHDGEVLDLADLANHARRVRDHATPAAYRHGTLRFLAKICNGEPIRNREELSSLTIASMRLIDTYKPRVYYAQNLTELGQDAEALNAIHPRLASSDPIGFIYVGEAVRRLLSRADRIRDAYHLAMQVARASFRYGHVQQCVRENVWILLNAGERLIQRDVALAAVREIGVGVPYSEIASELTAYLNQGFAFEVPTKVALELAKESGVYL